MFHANSASSNCTGFRRLRFFFFLGSTLCMLLLGEVGFASDEPVSGIQDSFSSQIGVCGSATRSLGFGACGGQTFPLPGKLKAHGS